METEGRESEMKLIERGVLALEKLASDPVVEYEAGPPICPHCGKYNPTVAMDSADAMSGPLSEMLVSGRCTSCGNEMFVVIESYSMHRELITARVEIEERNKRERAGNDENGRPTES